MTMLTQMILAQQSGYQQPFHRCYNLTTTRHCFTTVKDNLLANFENAINWCANINGYRLVKTDTVEVQLVLEKFLEEFELHSDDVWIPVRKSTTHKQWVWVDGNEFNDGITFCFLITLSLN